MDIRKEQSRLNSMTRDDWGHFDTHRWRMTDLICSTADKLTIEAEGEDDRPSLAILGAGNGNDLDFERLLETFGRIHLFDIDRGALEHLKGRHCQSNLAKKVIQFEPASDLTGVVAELEQYPINASDTDAGKLANKARQVSGIIDDKNFDVVVSTCLLSQLIDSVLKSVGDEHPHKHFLMIAVRDGHLRLMSRAVQPGGIGLLVTDFVSSDTLPSLKDANDDESVLAIARQAIDDRNFFTGTLPWAIKDSLSSLLEESSEQPWKICSPWKWQIGQKRSFLVTAIEFTKSL